MMFGTIELTAPGGSAWEFLLLFLVVILGPPLLERIRTPGLIGLLIGGFLIGPNGLGLLDRGSTTIPDLGQLGLLYLMFVAGAELDLALLKRYRRAAVGFGVLTFAVPMVLGTAVGFLLGWSALASLLLGSLLASHTLVLYPSVRNAGLAADPPVASAVGATVLTDTLALIVLAVVAAVSAGHQSGTEVALQLVLGLSVLMVVSFVVLPALVRQAYRTLGTDRPVRYVISVAAFLLAAVVAQTFDIEGIVGAFFVGLGINRQIPNEGPLMNRIDFFGTAVFVPVFLVSVGLLLNPVVMVQPETLGLAGLLILACVGGKALAAIFGKPLLRASWAETAVVFALTTPQAAATLASTTVGFQLGLFSDTVVNAVLVLILVSVTVSTLVADQSMPRVATPPSVQPLLGERIFVAVSSVDSAALALRFARDIAGRVGGVAEVQLFQDPSTTTHERLAALDRLDGMCRRLGHDVDPQVRITDHVARSVVLTASDRHASFVIAAVDEAGDRWSEAVQLVIDMPAPVAIVRGTVDEPLSRLTLLTPPEQPGDAGRIAAVLDAVMPRRADVVPDADLRPEDPDRVRELEFGEVAIVAIDALAEVGRVTPPDGSALVLVPVALASQSRAGRSGDSTPAKA